jgi:hypothetical protein
MSVSGRWQKEFKESCRKTQTTISCTAAHTRNKVICPLLFPMLCGLPHLDISVNDFLFWETAWSLTKAALNGCAFLEPLERHPKHREASNSAKKVN